VNGQIPLRCVWLLLGLATVPGAAVATTSTVEVTEPVVHVYEPNRVGLTRDSDDETFLDFTVSVRVVPLPPLNRLLEDRWSTVPDGLQLAFSTRLGQYLFTRDSAPVVAKRFNPKLFLRWELAEANHVDVAYGHESNGQNVTTLEQFEAAQAAAVGRGDEKRTAFDQISRGWDYAELRLSFASHDSTEGGWRTTVSIRHFLDKGGLLQGDAENINDWEEPGGVRKRQDVHGLRSVFRWHTSRGLWIERFKVSLTYETGIARPFEHHSFRLDAVFHPRGIPLFLSYARGHNGDLAQFDRVTDSYGVGLEFKPFEDPRE